jgi:hypothetical protein
VASFRIGDRSYSSKGEAKEAVRAILYAYPCGETLSDPEHARLIYDLLCMHPSAAQKIGAGVHHLSVEQNGPAIGNPGGSKGFWITRVDGSRTDFSYLVCLSPPKHEHKVLSALRSEIQEDITAFKRWFFGTQGEQVPCALTRELVTWDTCHVDHDNPSFDALVKDWMNVENLTWDLLRLVPQADGDTGGRRLQDPPAIESWVQYHRQYARLQIVSIRANLSKPRN